MRRLARANSRNGLLLYAARPNHTKDEAYERTAPPGRGEESSTQEHVHHQARRPPCLVVAEVHREHPVPTAGAEHHHVRPALAAQDALAPLATALLQGIAEAPYVALAAPPLGGPAQEAADFVVHEAPRGAVHRE